MFFEASADKCLSQYVTNCGTITVSTSIWVIRDKVDIRANNDHSLGERYTKVARVLVWMEGEAVKGLISAVTTRCGGLVGISHGLLSQE